MTNTLARFAFSKHTAGATISPARAPSPASDHFSRNSTSNDMKETTT